MVSQVEHDDMHPGGRCLRCPVEVEFREDLERKIEKLMRPPWYHRWIRRILYPRSGAVR